MSDWLPFVGLVVAQFVLVALFFARLRSEDHRRWHERRLECYRDLLAVSNAARDALARFERGGKAALHEVDVALDEARPLLAQVGFVASDNVRLAAEGIQHTMEMVSIIGPGTDHFPTATAFYAAERMFTEAVRREFGVARKRRPAASPERFHLTQPDTWKE